MISIRQADVSDSDAIARVLRASIRDLCVADHRGDPSVLARWLANKTPDVVESWIRNPDDVILAADHAGDLVCVGGVALRGEVLLNYVSPDFRFRGASRAMLVHMEGVLRTHGVKVATLISTGTAHRFYLANGWIDSDRSESKFGVTDFTMVKSL